MQVRSAALLSVPMGTRSLLAVGTARYFFGIFPQLTHQMVLRSSHCHCVRQPWETSSKPNCSKIFPIRSTPKPGYRISWQTMHSWTVDIYDQSGHIVRALDIGQQKSGVYRAKTNAAYWDGRNQNGELVTSGTYYYQFRAGDYSASRRMVIVK